MDLDGKFVREPVLLAEMQTSSVIDREAQIRAVFWEVAQVLVSPCVHPSSWTSLVFCLPLFCVAVKVLYLRQGKSM